MDIKKRFPHREKLDEYVHNHSSEFLSSAKGTVGHLEEEYILAKKKVTKGWSIIGAAVVFVWVTFAVLDSDTGIYKGDLDGWLGLGALAAAGFTIYKAWKSMDGTGQTIRTFNTELNKFLWPLIFKMFGLEAKLVSASIIWQLGKNDQITLDSNTFDITTVLASSELITEQFNRSNVDDVVETSIGDNKLKFAEIDIRNVTGSGKNRREKKIFRGYFVEFDLDLDLKGKTFVSTEGDKRGFGHQSFWKTLAGSADVQPTTLEWNTFEDLLHVASNNPTEARYVLSPSFMSDLYDWWKDKKLNIRVSFIGNKMYMLFPDNNVQMGRTISRLQENELMQYLQKVAPSIMFILHLVEDVQLQFNR